MGSVKHRRGQQRGVGEDVRDLNVECRGRVPFKVGERHKISSAGQRQFRQAMLMGITDHAADTRKGSDLLGSTLSVASGHHNAAIRIRAMNTADSSTSILVRSGRHGTGIEHGEIGLRGAASLFQALIAELPFQCRTVGLGSPAAKVLDVKTWHGSILTARSLLWSSDEAPHPAGGR